MQKYQDNLKNKIQTRNKRMFKASYVKMRQELDRQLEATREDSIKRTVAVLKAQGLPSWDLQVIKAERQARELEAQASRIHFQHMGDRMLEMV